MAEYKFQHYIPRTYLEAWENDHQKLRVHKKGTDSFFYKATDSVLGENDYYTLKAEDTLILTDGDKKDIFGSLLNYDIVLDDKKLKTLDDIMLNYYRFNDWLINTPDGTIIDRELIKHTIDSKRILDIEKGWHQIEGDWKIIREEITKTLDDTTYNLSIEVANRLIEYITSQKSRNNAKKDEYREIIDMLIGFLKMELSEDDYNKILDEYTEAYFLKAIRGYQDINPESIILKEQDLMMNLHIVLYKTTGNKTFFTSDNPAFTIIDTKFYKAKYAGLYFPVTPDILVALHKGDTFSYTIRDMPVNMIRRFNQRVIENSNRFYVKKDS